MKHYALMILYSLAHNRKNRKEIVIRSSFFLVILYVFSKLWQSTNFHNSVDPQLMTWYVAITEIIILSIPLIQFDIESDIRSGDIAYHLLKPISYLWLKICDSIGAFFCRFLILTALAIPFCIYLSGIVPSLTKLACALFAAGCAGIVSIFFHAIIGLTAFKLQDSSPLFWIWQRSSFLFGGVLLPLDFYPWYLKAIAKFLPFSSLLYAPAHLILEFQVSSFYFTLFLILFWGAVALILSHRLYLFLLKSLQINGG